MFTPFPEHIRTRLNVPRNAISAPTLMIARTPCDGLKILFLACISQLARGGQGGFRHYLSVHT